MVRVLDCSKSVPSCFPVMNCLLESWLPRQNAFTITHSRFSFLAFSSQLFTKPFILRLRDSSCFSLLLVALPLFVNGQALCNMQHAVDSRTMSPIRRKYSSQTRREILQKLHLGLIQLYQGKPTFASQGRPTSQRRTIHNPPLVH